MSCDLFLQNVPRCVWGKNHIISSNVYFSLSIKIKLVLTAYFFDFRWAKASASVKAAYQAKSDKDKARYAAEKAKFAAKK